MQIPKDMVMSFIHQRIGGDHAAQADAQLCPIRSTTSNTQT
jgi:hypothetical protein